MEARVEALYRYPVKGFSPEPMDRTEIALGGTVPYDRAFAVENGPSGFDPAAPRFLPKSRFLMLMKNERIASFHTRFAEVNGQFSVFRDGMQQIAASLLTADGCAELERWFTANFRDELRGPPRILSAAGHSFSDKPGKFLHLINLASVRALEERLGRSVHPLRFRPNIVIDGAPAWSELEWAKGIVQLPGIRLGGESRTTRCAATNVDPLTGARDMQIPRALDAHYGHCDFGIYLRAETAGAIAVGDRLQTIATALPF